MTLENMTSKELKAMAKELKVKNWWNLKKTELIAEIEKIQSAEEETTAYEVDNSDNDEVTAYEVDNEATEDVQNDVNDENIVEESTEAPESAQVETKKSKRKEDLIEYNGKIQNLSAWAKELGMPGQTLYARLHISNWPVEKAFTTPMRKKEEEA